MFLRSRMKDYLGPKISYYLFYPTPSDYIGQLDPEVLPGKGFFQLFFQVKETIGIEV
jgi:hypothetical protein